MNIHTHKHLAQGTEAAMESKLPRSHRHERRQLGHTRAGARAAGAGRSKRAALPVEPRCATHVSGSTELRLPAGTAQIVFGAILGGVGASCSRSRLTLPICLRAVGTAEAVELVARAFTCAAVLVQFPAAIAIKIAVARMCSIRSQFPFEAGRWAIVVLCGLSNSIGFVEKTHGHEHLCDGLERVADGGRPGRHVAAVQELIDVLLTAVLGAD